MSAMERERLEPRPMVPRLLSCGCESVEYADAPDGTEVKCWRHGTARIVDSDSEVDR